MGIETKWAAKLKKFDTWSFTEKACRSLPVTTVEYPEIGMSVQSVKVGPQLEGNCQPHTGTRQEDLPATEQQQQGHLPSASAEVEPGASAAADLQPPEGNSGWGVRHSLLEGFSAFLDMKRCKDWDHEVSS